MNYTVATPHTIMSVLLACPQLEVLKIAGIPKLVSYQSSSECSGNPDFIQVAGCIPALKKSHENEYLEPIPIFPALRSLKLRLTELANSDLAALLPHCPNLTTLDISFTLIKHIPLDSPFPQLKKLCLTSTSISGTNLVNVLKRVPMLEVLYLGALGDSVPSTSKGAGTGVSAGTLTDSLLRDVTDALERCPNLKNVNLVSNLKLGSGGSVDRALRDFVRRVGRNCEVR
jgi:Leucine-rich repeat (LRR) protein